MLSRIATKQLNDKQLTDKQLNNIMNLESPKIAIEKSSEDVFNFLSNIKNFESLMPESISKFEVLSEDTFLFALKGMPEIILKKKEVLPPNKIVLGAAGGKLDFSLNTVSPYLAHNTLL